MLCVYPQHPSNSSKAPRPSPSPSPTPDSEPIAFHISIYHCVFCIRNLSIVYLSIYLLYIRTSVYIPKSPKRKYISEAIKNNF